MTDIDRLIERAAAGDRTTYEFTKETFEALLARTVELQTQLKKATTPEYFWSFDDPEQCYESIKDALDETSPDDVVKLATGKNLGIVYGATKVLTVDEYGDMDETEVVSFDNWSDANMCFLESLAAVRKATGFGDEE